MASLICPRASQLSIPIARTALPTTYQPTRSFFSTDARPLGSQTPPSSRPTRQLQYNSFLPSLVLVRHASTDPTSAPSTTTSEEILTWNRFFDLRRKRRYLNLASSLVTAGATIGVAGPIIAQQDIDGWAAQISGLDPIIVLGATTFAAAAGGWLCGPSFGTAVFKIWAGRKGWNIPIAEVGGWSI